MKLTNLDVRIWILMYLCKSWCISTNLDAYIYESRWIYANPDVYIWIFMYVQCFLTILEFDWLRKRATARVTPVQLLPVRKPLQIVSVMRRRMPRKSQFFHLKWNFSFTKRTLWSEGKHQRWNTWPSYSLKRQVFFSFCSQHCWFSSCFSWSADTPFNWILFQSFIFKSHSIFFHWRKYMISRNSPANKNLAALSRVRLFV